MRRRLIALYLGIYLIAPLPWIGTPGTVGGSLLLAAIALVAVALGAVTVTGRVPNYGPEVSILAAVAFLVALMGAGAYPILLFIPVQVVLGGRLASSARAQTVDRRDDEHDADDDS